MMLIKLIVLATALIEFEEYHEHEEYEEYKEEIAPVEEKSALPINWHDLDPSLAAVFERLVVNGSVVIDYGAQTGATTLVLSQLVGPSGKVIAFEPDAYYFNILSRIMDEKGVLNAELYRHGQEKEEDFLSFQSENISLIKIAADGKEDVVLDKAALLIRSLRPVLIIDMLGGIPIEMADKYVKKEFYDRMEQIKKLGYVVQRINASYYLATPIGRKSHLP